MSTASPRFSWLRVNAIARRHAYVLRRSPHRLFDVTIWPLVDVVLFGSIGVFVSQNEEAGADAFGYLIAGIILWHVVYQSQIALSTGFLEEMWSRNVLNIMVTPLREIEYVAGVIIFGFVKLTMGVGLVALTALALFSFDVTDLGFGLIPIAGVLLIVGWAIALLVIGVVFRFGSGAEALAWGILFAVLPLSGVFYPVEALPGALQPIAQALPTTHAFTAMRSLVDGNGLPWNEILIGAIGALVLTIGALVFLARMLMTFRRRGYIGRYL